MRTILSCLLLAGCVTDPAIPTVTQVPVPVSCIKGEPPAKPAVISEGEILAMTDYAATLTTWTERLILKSYAEKASAIIDACR